MVQTPARQASPFVGMNGQTREKQNITKCRDKRQKIHHFDCEKELQSTFSSGKFKLYNKGHKNSKEFCWQEN